VHALATVRTSPAPAAAHHLRLQQQQHSRNTSRFYQHNRSPKQLLRAASPPQQQQQQTQPYGLSPTSYQQIQQLLPTAPLEQLAQGRLQDSDQHQDNKDITILRGGNSFLGARTASILSTDRGHHHVLQQLHSASSGGSLTSTPRSAHVAASLAHSHLSKTPADALSPMQVLAVCAAVVQEDAAFEAAGISPLMLASLCLIESAGCPHAKQYREHLGDTAHGLCQVSQPLFCCWFVGCIAEPLVGYPVKQAPIHNASSSPECIWVGCRWSLCHNAARAQLPDTSMPWCSTDRPLSAHCGCALCCLGPLLTVH
jgi:hypothetical protein